MLSFKKHKNFSKNENGGIDLLAQKIVSAVLFYQRKIAWQLQSQSEKLSLNHKKIILLLFCFAAVGLCIFSVTRNFLYNSGSAFNINKMNKPVYTGDHNYLVRNDSVITKQDYRRIQMFRKLMDSLSRSSSGKLVYDSLFKNRPALMDSIKMIELFYQSPINK